MDDDTNRDREKTEQIKELSWLEPIRADMIVSQENIALPSKSNHVEAIQEQNNIVTYVTNFVRLKLTVGLLSFMA